VALQGTRSWTVRGGAAATESVVAEFAQRRGIDMGRGDQRVSLARRTGERPQGGGAGVTPEEDLPLRGRVDLEPGDGDRLEVTMTLRPLGAGMLMGRGPVTGALRRRYEQLFGELLNDLGLALGDDRA